MAPANNASSDSTLTAMVDALRLFQAVFTKIQDVYLALLLLTTLLTPVVSQAVIE